VFLEIRFPEYLLMQKLEIPVLLITFNRPDVTRTVLERILEVNPPKIYFFNDAPREGNENDRIKCAEIREMARSLPYQGELLTRFEEKNLGCKGGESTAMTWLFENEEMGIVIEDDILPTREFFFYCQDMLHRYRYDDRIFSVSGCNLVNEWKPAHHDYFYSFFGSFWGWAGWQRVWKRYNVDMPEWNNPMVKELVLQFLPTEEYRKLRIAEFDSLVAGVTSTWDFQFCFYHYLNHGLSLVPARNMVVNIGINRADAVHMVAESPFSDLRAFPQNLPMRPNTLMVPDFGYDVEVVRKGHPYLFERPVFSPPPTPTLTQRIRMEIGRQIGETGVLRDLTNKLRGR
jgi:hypothetical protein